MNRDRQAGSAGAKPTDRPGESPTEPLGRAVPAGSAELTQPIAVGDTTGPPPSDPDSEQTQVIPKQSTGSRGPSLLKASSTMAIATLISRVTGFGWKFVLAMIIGFGVTNDSFTVANTLPNSIFELLLGGVLTSVVVPVLVSAAKSDPDGGEAYVQRLLSIAAIILGAGTVLSLVAAPLLTTIFVTPGDSSNQALVTAFAYLLLPQILFYGASALLSAILQSKQVFGPPVWAPVMNNLVVLATLGVYALIPGELTLDPVRMSDPHLLTLGIGVTFGVLVQAAYQIPALRKTGFRFQWRLEWDSRLSEFGALTAWMLGYVAISMVGLAVLTRVGTGAAGGAWSIYTYAWMLLQLPYGVIGFSVMTAILPRMSAAAADRDYPKLIEDLSLGNRLSTVALLPISAVMTALGVPLAVGLFSIGAASSRAEDLGFAIAVSAFGVLPYAITMMQMRAFNAMKDARTPTMIMLIMTVVKIALAVAVPMVLPSEDVVYGLTVVNSFGFLVGWIVGEAWLRHRLGPLGSRRLLATLGKTTLASVIGGLAAWVVAYGVDGAIAGEGGLGTGWLQLIAGGLVGLAVIFGLMHVLRVAELRPAFGRLAAALRRR